MAGLDSDESHSDLTRLAKPKVAGSNPVFRSQQKETATSRRCTGSHVRTSTAFPLGDAPELIANLETFWRRKQGPHLIC